MQVDIHKILHQYWGYNQFRPSQESIINAAINGIDTLALLPTGGGKSICFQVPALAKKGMCLVISPLIALMKDQVENLNKKGIKAVSISSELNYHQIDNVLENCAYDNVKFLYLSPERLSSDIFLKRVEKLPINLIAVDEAHCISQWGYDFRPAYLKISELRQYVSAPILALTATATPEVVKDIQNKLEFKKHHVIQKSFARENVSYNVLPEEDKMGRLLKICDKIPGTGIVYVRNRRKTKEISSFLNLRNISADFYHAGLKMAERNEKQENWIQNKTRIIVSTNAFGMGIDKPDVRFVVHLDVPESLEAYFQEAGRGGRDEKQAWAILLFSNVDVKALDDNFINSFPEPETIRKVYHSLCNYFQLAEGNGAFQHFNFDINEFGKKSGFKTQEVFYSLQFLEKEGYFSIQEGVLTKSKIKIICSREILENNNSKTEILKTLLRSYGGILDELVPINEFEIAQRLQIKKDELIAKLKTLNKEEYIIYEEKSDEAQITFIDDRLPLKNITISKDHYETRKKIALNRINAVKSYLFNDKICRSIQLLQYFGEISEKKCGQCDVCRKNNSSPSEEEVKKFIDQLLPFQNKQITIENLLKEVKGIRQNKKMEILRLLIDENYLDIDSKNNRFVTVKL